VVAKVRIGSTESALRGLEKVLTGHAGQAVPEVGGPLVAGVMAQGEERATHPEAERNSPEHTRSTLGCVWLRACRGRRTRGSGQERIHRPFRAVTRRDPRRVRVVRGARSEGLLRLP
jgi:hypothetical protein